MRGRTAAVLALVALLLIQPTSITAQPADADPVPAEPRSACELLDPEEVAQAIGAEEVDAEDLTGLLEDPDGWIDTCQYVRDRELGLPVVSLTLASGPGYLATFDELRLQADATPLDDIGDDAVLQMPVIWGLDQPAGSLQVRVGDTVLEVALGVSGVTSDGTLVQLGDRDAQTALLRALAGLAAERIAEGPPPPVEVPPLCDLLSLADASTLVGSSLAAAEVLVENDEWGPACYYRDADDDVLLLVGVTAGPDAIARFEGCSASGRPTQGVGDAAFIGGGDCESILAGSYFIEEPLMVRSGETVLVVGAVTEEQGPVNKVGDPEAQVAIARRVLGALGLDPGATAAPVDASVLEHPCALLSDEEVADVVGVPITSVEEYPPDGSSATGSCQYRAQDGNAMPLSLRIGMGDEAMEEWASYGSYRKGDKVAVEGLGDEALSEIVEGYDLDGPLVSMWVRVGQTLLQLDMGSVERLPDYTNRAAGPPDVQLEMLRTLAELVLTRLSG